MNDTTFNDGFLDGFDDVETVEDSEPVETDVEEVEDTETVEETEDTAAEDKTEDAVEDTTEAVPTDPETIDYSYNHRTTALNYASVKSIAESLGMSAQDVVTILQKGSNYDVLQSRQDPYKGAIDRIDRFANGNKLSREEAIKRTIDALDVVESARYIDEIKAQYPDATPKYLQDMAMMRVRQDLNTPVLPTEEENKAEVERQQKWVSFFKAHPDQSADSLSPRMVEALENFEDPEFVFVSERNAELERQLKEIREKQDKAARSTGTSKRTSGATGKDAFLDAFLG